MAKKREVIDALSGIQKGIKDFPYDFDNFALALVEKAVITEIKDSKEVDLVNWFDFSNRDEEGNPSYPSYVQPNHRPVLLFEIEARNRLSSAGLRLDLFKFINPENSPNNGISRPFEKYNFIVDLVSFTATGESNQPIFLTYEVEKKPLEIPISNRDSFSHGNPNEIYITINGWDAKGRKISNIDFSWRAKVMRTIYEFIEY